MASDKVVIVVGLRWISTSFQFDLDSKLFCLDQQGFTRFNIQHLEDLT